MPVGCVIDGSLCSNVTEEWSVVRLSQRDLAYPVSADQILTPGLDINKVLFENEGYTSSALDSLVSYLDLGYQNMFLDLYYNPQAKLWQLCPDYFPSNPQLGEIYNLTRPNAPDAVCQPNTTFGALLISVGNYISLSNTNIAAHLLRLSLRLRELPVEKHSNSTKGMSALMGDTSLNTTLTRTLGNMMFTPDTLESARTTDMTTTEGTLRDEDGRDRNSTWPSLRNVLLEYHRRIVVSVVTDGINSNVNDLDPHWVFYNDNDTFTYINVLPVEADNPDYKSLSNASFLSAGIWGTDFEYKYAKAIELGYSPVMNESMTSDSMLDLVQSHTWGWAHGEPAIQTDKERSDMMKANEIRCCALQTTDGWVVANCLDSYRVLCRKEDDPFVWRLSDGYNSYFDADCPSGYEFVAPRTALEVRAAKRVVGEESAWADLNSLSLPNCWVTGGVSAACPYNIIQSNRNGVALIVVTATVSVCLVAAMILFEWDRMRYPLIFNPGSRRRRQLQQTAPDGIPN